MLKDKQKNLQVLCIVRVPKDKFSNRTRRGEESSTRKLKRENQKNYLRTTSQEDIEASCLTTIL